MVILFVAQNLHGKVIRESCFTDAEFSVNQPNVYLPDSIIQSLCKQTIDLCVEACVRHSLCQSVNIEQEPDRVCTLFRHDLTETGVRKTSRKDSIYIQTADNRTQVY